MYFYYSLLTKQINSLLLVSSYRDTINPGKDDRANDYFQIYYFGDFYLKNCIEKRLSETKKYDFRLKHRSVIQYSYDSNATARSPTEGYNMDEDLAELRLWLLENAIKYYDEKEHLKYLTENEEYVNNKSVFKNFQVKFIDFPKDQNSLKNKIEYELIEGKNKIVKFVNIFSAKIDLKKITSIIAHLELEK